MGDARSDDDLLNTVQACAYAHGIAVTGAVGSPEDARMSAVESIEAFAELRARIQNLRAAVRAADAFFACDGVSDDGPVRAAYDVARAKCGEVT